MMYVYRHTEAQSSLVAATHPPMSGPIIKGWADLIDSIYKPKVGNFSVFTHLNIKVAKINVLAKKFNFDTF